MPCARSSRRAARLSSRSVTDLVVATPVFLDLTFVGMESLPALGEERFAGELLRSPGGGAITAVGAARLGLSTAVAAPLGDDVAGELVREALAKEGVEVIAHADGAADADDGRDAVRQRPGDGDGRPGRTRLRRRRRRPARRGPSRRTSTCSTSCRRARGVRHLRRATRRARSRAVRPPRSPACARSS